MERLLGQCGVTTVKISRRIVATMGEEEEEEERVVVEEEGVVVEDLEVVVEGPGVSDSRSGSTTLAGLYRKAF